MASQGASEISLWILSSLTFYLWYFVFVSTAFSDEQNLQTAVFVLNLLILSCEEPMFNVINCLKYLIFLMKLRQMLN